MSRDPRPPARSESTPWIENRCRFKIVVEIAIDGVGCIIAVEIDPIIKGRRST
jgi:hypothetical protein